MCDYFSDCVSSTAAWSEDVRSVTNIRHTHNHRIDCEDYRRVSDEYKSAEEERWNQIRGYEYALSRELDPRVD